MSGWAAGSSGPVAGSRLTGKTNSSFRRKEPDFAVMKRFKNWRPWSRFGYGKGLFGTGIRSRQLLAEQVRRRRRSIRVLVVLLVSLVGAVSVLHASGGTQSIGWDPSGSSEELSSSSEEEAAQADPELPRGPTPEQAPEQQLDTSSPAAVAYGTVASELPDIDPEDVQGVYQSELDPSWASVRVVIPEEERGTYIVFLQRENDSWEARKSVRADEPEHPEYEKAVLDEVPEDLVGSLYPQSMAATADPSGLLMEPVETGTLPSVEAAEVPPAEAVTDGVPEEEHERVQEGLEEVRQVVEDYGTEHEGIAGVYVRDINGGYGYGVLPDEVFFGASVMKIPIMVAVYRKIDAGEFALNDTFETEPEDWAGGAGWLQWQEAGTSHTVQDYLLLMMTQSDNVATNVLLRLVGGPEHVNEVSSSLGAPDTVLIQKVTSERAAVPALDNRTTPRSMSTILGKIAAGEAASPGSCKEMIELMRQNDLESGLEEGLPEDVEAAHKGGWLYKVYDEAGVVGHEEHPYAVAIFTKYGLEDPKQGKDLLKEISEAVYQTQDG